MRLSSFAVLVPLSLFAAACGSGPLGTTETTSAALVALAPIESCQQLDEYLRERARAQMNASLDTYVQQVNAGNYAYCYAESYAVSGVAAISGSDDSASSSSNGSNSAASSPSSVSETNNQVVGVDEADLVKTDGQYLYLAQSDELRIVRAWPAAETAASATLSLGGTAKRLLVQGDRAVVFVSIARPTAGAGAWMSASGRDCTYGYDCDFSGDGTATDLVVVDISDRAAPKVLRRISFAGSLIAARRIGDIVHTVVSIGSLDVPGLKTPSLYGSCGSDKAELLAEIERVRAANNAIIDAAHFDIGAIAKEGDQPLGSPVCADDYRELSADGSALTTVASLDLGGTAAPTLTSIVSRAGAVYASTTSLYISVVHQRSGMALWYDGQTADQASTVHAFRIGQDPRATAYLGSGIVPGRVLNQFSMDEYGGDLRIATTTGHVPDPSVKSTLSVLRLSGGALETVGQIDGVAPTEDIRSVRFDGERGYLVSFKKTDPLFVLDLSTPTAPQIVGELKIPGFSTYLHRLDAGHLLALGYEADDQGTFAFFNGIQLQIFDVTRPTEPALLQKKVFGTRGSSSSALTDHLGFTFLADRHLLTLPMSICDGGGNGQYGTLSFSGVVALNASVEGGFVELGRLEEPYPASSTSFYYGAACSDWWTNSNSVVERTVVLDDYLYAISDHRVRVQNLNNLGTDVGVVDFPSSTP